MLVQQAIGTRPLLCLGAGQHVKMQIGSLVPSGEHLEFNAQAFPEVALNIREHIGLGRRGKTADLRQRLVTGVLPDEAGHIKVVWPKVAAPFRQAVRLIENPGTNLTLTDRSPESLVAELLGRHKQNADIAHLDLLQYLGALRHGKQAIQRCGALDVALQQSVDLILHQ